MGLSPLSTTFPLRSDLRFVLSTSQSRCALQALSLNSGSLVVFSGFGRWIGLRNGVCCCRVRGRDSLNHRQSCRVVIMRSGGDRDENASGEESTESLFMRELRRRGMSPSSEEKNSLGTDTKTKEEYGDDGSPRSRGRGWSQTDIPKVAQQTDNQLKRTMALNSEGLDGLIPRAQELLKLGGSFWVIFWPLILPALAAFLALYMYFGASFIHSGSHQGQPAYDPSQLLEERIPGNLGPARVSLHTKSQ